MAVRQRLARPLPGEERPLPLKERRLSPPFAAASKPHNAVIINDADWKRMKWKAIGLGIFGRYAAVWFGDESDPDT
jgi:hypothetical protein